MYQGELNQLVVWIDNAAYLQLNFNQTSIIPHSIKRLGDYLVFVPLLELEAWQAQFELTSMALADYVNLKLPAIIIEQQQCCTLWHDLHQPDDYLATIEPINSNELAWLWLLSSQIPPVDQSIRLFTSYANQISIQRIKSSYSFWCLVKNNEAERSIMDNELRKSEHRPILPNPIPIPMPPPPAVLGKWPANSNGILPNVARYRWPETMQWIANLPKSREHLLMEFGVNLIFPSLMLRHFAYTTRWYECPMDWLVYARGFYAFLQQPERLRGYLYGASISPAEHKQLVELCSSSMFIGQHDALTYIDSLECSITRSLVEATLYYALPFLLSDSDYQAHYPSRILDVYLFVVAASDLLWRTDKLLMIIDAEVSSIEDFGFF